MNHEIVAAKIGNTITNSIPVIKASLLLGKDVQWLTRQHMKLMASFDLGARWEHLAKGRTLFEVEEDDYSYLTLEVT